MRKASGNLLKMRSLGGFSYGGENDFKIPPTRVSHKNYTA
ncbi:hypothetical protein HPHPH44_0720 [Helicobacter pylori Hp H-44]|nr:hypothetical protein HPHPH44_0720 [Helicobacter pylori Hp H-44]